MIRKQGRGGGTAGSVATDRAAAKAITALDDTEIEGCKLNVKPTEKKPNAANARTRHGACGPRRHRPAPRRILIPEPDDRRFHRVAPAVQSQSAIAREQIDGIEAPPRRSFEVVVRPARRATASFQVERRRLPPRV